MMRGNTTEAILKVFIMILAVLFCVVTAFTVIAMGSRVSAEEETAVSEAPAENPYGFADEKWQEGSVYYNGKSYRYREGLQTYLIMGVDSDDVVKPAEDSISGGQSDAMFLVVTDRAEESIRVISVNRNTMTSVEVYDEEGKRLGYSDMQICIQHGFGDGMRLSCNRSVDALRRLFYNIPVSGFYALNMGGIIPFNDALNGVTVTATEDVERNGVEIAEGEEITLMGEEAYAFLRHRDIKVAGSADARLARQEEYVTAMLDKLMKSPSLAAKAYEAAADYTVTNIDFVKLMSQIKGYEFNRETDVYTLPGQTVRNGDYEEFHVDEDGLMEIIMSVFYKETDNTAQ